jgi:hypothetical protein
MGISSRRLPSLAGTSFKVVTEARLQSGGAPVKIAVRVSICDVCECSRISVPVCMSALIGEFHCSLSCLCHCIRIRRF